MKILVAGTGISGIGSAKLLLNHGYQVVVFDENESVDVNKVRNEIIGEAKDSSDRLSFALGKLSDRDIQGAEYCVMSPGISPRKPFAIELVEKGVSCISEIEIAYRLGRGRVAAITGTNGKTTTTALLGQIVREAGLDGRTLGNIGKAYTGEVDSLTDDSVSVIEVAGFHLETIVDFRPNVSAILNITPDHLDRFGTMEAYTKAKERITENQEPSDTCVLNYEDEELRDFGSKIKAKVLYYSSERELSEGGFLRGDDLVIKLSGKEEILCNKDQMLLLGKHNYENVLAATLMALSLGISLDSIRKTVAHFKSVEHRIEYVTTKNEVEYYNDSKGTNPDASIKAIEAMRRPIVLIAGGYDKHVSFDELIDTAMGKVTNMIILGACGDQIRETCDRKGFTSYTMAEGFREAVELSMKIAKPGEAVLLSPACASWDMFKNFEIRGTEFKKIVLEK